MGTAGQKISIVVGSRGPTWGVAAKVRDTRYVPTGDERELIGCSARWWGSFYVSVGYTAGVMVGVFATSDTQMKEILIGLRRSELDLGLMESDRFPLGIRSERASKGVIVKPRRGTNGRPKVSRLTRSEVSRLHQPQLRQILRLPIATY